MKKKAFTLVELLAVIVVLAVILAIAIPSITNIIASSKKASFKSDARFILDQTRIELSKNDTFDPTTINMDTLGNYNISNENYDLMSVSMIDSKPYIYVVGKNKWDGYKACGTYNNMQVVPITDTETC